MLFFFLFFFSTAVTKSKKKKHPKLLREVSVFDNLKRTKKIRLPERTLFPTQSPKRSPSPTKRPERTPVEIRVIKRKEEMKNKYEQNDLVQKLRSTSRTVNLPKPTMTPIPDNVPRRPEEENFDEWDVIRPPQTPAPTPYHTFSEEEIRRANGEEEDDDDEYEDVFDDEENSDEEIFNNYKREEKVDEKQEDKKDKKEDVPDKSKATEETAVSTEIDKAEEERRKFKKQIQDDFKINDADLNAYVNYRRQITPSRSPRRRLKRKRVSKEEKEKAKFRKLFYIPTATENNNPCHRSAIFVDGKCVCKHGLVGDGYINCSYPVPVFLSVTPLLLSGINPTLIRCRFNKTDFIPQGAFCKVGRIIVGGRITDNNEIECEVKPALGRKNVRISFDGVNWCNEKKTIVFEEKKIGNMRKWAGFSLFLFLGITATLFILLVRSKALKYIKRRMKRSTKETLQKSIKIQQKSGQSVINRVRNVFNRKSNREEENLLIPNN